MTNPAGAAVVNAIGSIRQLLRGEVNNPHRYLVIVPGSPDSHRVPVQIQSEFRPKKLSAYYPLAGAQTGSAAH
jgi:hypothetical protein